MKMALYRRNNWQEDVRTGSDEVEEQLCHDKAYSVALLASKATLWTPAVTSMLEAPTSALDMYLKAIELERKDQLSEALVYYRRAFRLDSDVDRAYRQYEQQAVAGVATAGSSNDVSSSAAAGNTELLKATNTSRLPVLPNSSSFAASNHTMGNVKDPLDVLAIQFNQQDTQYIPAIDYKPMPIRKLPGEILVQVLQHLALHSVSSVAKFALVCKRFFIATRSPTLWRFLCEHVFREPGMSMEKSKRVQAEVVTSLYGGYWLRMYIERPRVRYDGVYISVCQYIRPGVSETAWTQPVHLVTYYRYLRFFPDGTIIKYLSTDEPSNVVRLLTPNFSQRQVFHGSFEIRNEDEIVIEMRDLLARPRERFKMVLHHIKKSHRGRLCKLGWQEYVSEKEGRDEGTSYDLKLMRPYVFSVVRSYNTAL